MGLSCTQLLTLIQSLIIRKLQGSSGGSVTGLMSWSSMISSILGHIVSQENLEGVIDGRLNQFVVDTYNQIKCQITGSESNKISSEWVMGQIS